MNSHFFYRLLCCSLSELHIWKNELALREHPARLFLSFCPLPVGGTCIYCRITGYMFPLFGVTYYLQDFQYTYTSTFRSNGIISLSIKGYIAHMFAKACSLLLAFCKV